MPSLDGHVLVSMQAVSAGVWTMSVEKVVAAPAAAAFLGQTSRLGKKCWNARRRQGFGDVNRNLHWGSGELAYDRRRRPWIGESVTTYSDGSPSSVHTTDFAYDGNQIALQFDGTSAPARPFP